MSAHSKGSQHGGYYFGEREGGVTRACMQTDWRALVTTYRERTRNTYLHDHPPSPSPGCVEKGRHLQGAHQALGPSSGWSSLPPPTCLSGIGTTCGNPHGWVKPRMSPLTAPADPSMSQVGDSQKQSAPLVNRKPWDSSLSPQGPCRKRQQKPRDQLISVHRVFTGKDGHAPRISKILLHSCPCVCRHIYVCVDAHICVDACVCVCVYVWANWPGSLCVDIYTCVWVCRTYSRDSKILDSFKIFLWFIKIYLFISFFRLTLFLPWVCGFILNGLPGQRGMTHFVSGLPGMLQGRHWRAETQCANRTPAIRFCDCDMKADRSRIFCTGLQGVGYAISRCRTA